MSLIAGYVSPRPRYSTEELLGRVQAFSIVPGDTGESYEETVVAVPYGHLIVKHKAAYPIPPRLVGDDQRNALATLGFIVSDDGVVDPKHLLSSCATTSGRALTECEGEFITVFADGMSGAVHLVNDRFAARPCYVLRSGSGVYFSSNVAFVLYLARERYRPDVVGWLETFSYAHTNGPRTTIAGVERLRPATHLTIQPDSVDVRRYWRLEHRPDRDLDPARHSAEVFDAFRTSTERRARLVGRGVLALSGGLDSRLVAGAVPHDTDFEAFTFVDVPGATTTAQTRAAAAVCASLGLRHRIETLASRFTEPAAVISLAGGMRPYHHMAIAMAYVAQIQRRHAAYLMGGGPGDVLAGSYIPSPAYLDPARIETCMKDAYRRRIARSQHWPLVFRDDVIAAARQAVEDDLAASFAAVSGPTAAHRVTAWGMVYRQPAFTFTSVFHTHPDVTEAWSHLGYRYSDLMLQLPAEWLYDEAFYAYMIHAQLPQLRHVPYANTGALLTGRVPTLALPRESLKARARHMAERVGARRARRLIRALLPRRPANPRPWLVLSDDALMTEVRDILHSVPSLAEVLDIPRCERFLDDVRAKRFTTSPYEEVLGGLTSMCVSATALP